MIFAGATLQKVVPCERKSRRASGSGSGDLVGLAYVGTHTSWEFRIKPGGVPRDSVVGHTLCCLVQSGAVGVGGGGLIEQIAKLLLPGPERLFAPHDIAVTGMT